MVLLVMSRLLTNAWFRCRDGSRRDTICLLLVGGKTPDVTSVRRTYVDIMAEQKLKAQQVGYCYAYVLYAGFRFCA